jgi:CrcB protein
MIFWIGIGGMIGAVSRYVLGKWITSRTKHSYPFGTWLVNLLGCFGLGVLFALNVKGQLDEWTWFTVGIGFFGAFTTFSTFGYETVQLLEAQNMKQAFIYVLSSLILGIVAVWFGFIYGGVLN